MKSVQIINLGVPPGGRYQEFGVKTPEGVYCISQVYPSRTCRAAAREAAKKHGLDHYIDENNNKVLI